MKTAAGWVREDVARHQLAGARGGAAGADRIWGEPDTRLPEITALIDPEQFRIDDAGSVGHRGHPRRGRHGQDHHRPAPGRLAALPGSPQVRREADAGGDAGEALRRYVSRVLPALDVHGVSVRTFADWALRVLKRLVPAARGRQFTDDEAAVGARRPRATR
ncbi:MAG: hypothetical protein R3F43_16155 [bacterium]